MTTFVLVHGAWSGAFSYRKVRPLLIERGHEVFTPTLTGLGDRSHLANPQVNLTTHVQDVVNTVLYEDLSEIVLVGHSYGGMVITGAIEHVADRVRHLVYIDAFLPNDGESLFTLTGRSGRLPIELGTEYLDAGLGLTWAPDDPADGEFSDARRRPQSVATFTEPVHLERPLEEYPFTRTYIKATAESRTNGASAFIRAGDYAKASAAWHYEEIETNHLVTANRPRELVDILLNVD